VREHAGAVLALVVLGALSLVASEGCSRKGSPSSAAVLETMRQLTAAPVLAKETVEQALEAEFVVDGDNPWFTSFAGQPRPGTRLEKSVKLIDLRVPTPRNDAMREPLLVLDLRDDAGISATDVESLLGRPAEVSVPEPNGVTSLSYIYAFVPHRLWIGFGHGSTKPVHGMAIHRNETKAGG
jgi:hypothetical protein